MLSLRGIKKRYEGQWLLNGVDLDVSEGELLCLLGESGSGKSTLLRITAGLEETEAGRVFWNCQDITDLQPNERCFGLMFQDYALFPHRTVAQNVAFGLRMKGLPRHEVEQKVTEALKTIHMASFADRQVTELSGGEQQRVAIARALAPDPHLLMLDEPLGAPTIPSFSLIRLRRSCTAAVNPPFMSPTTVKKRSPSRIASPCCMRGTSCKPARQSCCLKSLSTPGLQAFYVSAI